MDDANNEKPSNPSANVEKSEGENTTKENINTEIEQSTKEILGTNEQDFTAKDEGQVTEKPETPPGIPENDEEHVDHTSDKSNETQTASSNNDKEDSPPSNSLKDSFKKPALLVGPRKGKAVKLRSISSQVTPLPKSENNIELDSNPDDFTSSVVEEVKSSRLSDVKPLEPSKDKILPYSEPPWSGMPESEYKLEVLKSGVILETIDLSRKKFHVVGRLPNCDISLAHPTISRHHAVLQYRITEDEKNGKGLYLYDVGSTHGTFWNGNRIRPNMYVRLRGGHMIHFGCSQRKFIVQTPEDDIEEESELTVTELKEKRRQELERRSLLEKQKQLEIEEQERIRKEAEEAEGIDWGMGEDADEETDLTENPYASTNNEELFLEDPKKTLRGWFEREGYDLQYEVEEKGMGQFLCWVDLPIENAVGRMVKAEALVKGKKKESVVQCALEACRILDRYGLLRQANHESKKRKARNWEEEDFYDSDEDNFQDRTGSIERKRERRMIMAGKMKATVENYDSLLEKRGEVIKKIIEIERKLKLNQQAKEAKAKDGDEDDLDAFMSNLSTSLLNKADITKYKVELQSLRKEEGRLIKLLELTKPVNLPEFKPVTVKTDDLVPSTTRVPGMVGNKQKLKVLRNESQRIETKKEENEEPMVVDTTEKMVKTSATEVDDHLQQSSNENDNLPEEESNVKSVATENEDCTPKLVSTKGDVKEEGKRKKHNSKRTQNKMHKMAKNIQEGSQEDAFREDYSTWVPPTNQSGDGKTSLNDKYGY